ncbi:MAG: AraC family transcriptional regulator [Bacteroidota bacterium]
MNDHRQQNIEYSSRINRTLDYIEKNLDKPFTLDELAGVSLFSKYHFNRIFHAHMGESPFQFILRVRLQKAAAQLLYHQRDNISEIAARCGFTDLSVFSRNFSKCFGLSPTSYRRQHSNLSQTDSNSRQDDTKPSPYLCPERKTIKWRTTMKTNLGVEVKNLPEMTLAYVRHVGPYKGDSKLFEKLWGQICTWAGARGLMEQAEISFLVIYHDDPKVTDDDKLRMSVCLTVPKGTRVDGEIGRMDLEAAKYVIARFEVDADGFMEAWDWVYGEWFPASGYQPDDKPCFEIYPEEPKDGKFLVEICVPVRPL